MNPSDSLTMKDQVELSVEGHDHFIGMMRQGRSPPNPPAPSSTPSVTTTAELLPGSISPDEFGVFYESQGWSMNQPGNYENSNNWIYGQNHVYPNTNNNVDPRQLQPQWNSYASHDNLRTGYLHHSETNIAPYAPSDFVNEFAYDMAAPNPYHPTGHSLPAQSYPPTAVYPPSMHRTQAPRSTPTPPSEPAAHQASGPGPMCVPFNVTAPAHPLLRRYVPASIQSPSLGHTPSSGQTPSTSRTPSLGRVPSPMYLSVPPQEAFVYDAPALGRAPAIHDASSIHRPFIAQQLPVALDTPPIVDVSARDQPDGEDAPDAEQPALDPKGPVNVALVAKEKQARTVFKRQNSQNDEAVQVGESVSVIQTATGLSFVGTLWSPPTNDPTIPSTDAEIKACVDGLVKAMRNLTNVREKIGTGQNKNRWSAASQFYSNNEFVGAASLLVKAMIKIHRNGWTKPIFDKGERENCQMTMFYTFEDRYNILRELLRCSKTSCQDILKGSRVFIILANPRILIFRTATNRTANVNKAGLIQAGKEALEAGEALDGNEQPDEEQSDNDDAPKKKSTKCKAPIKTKKRTREEVFVAEDPAIQPPRKKLAVKKHRSA